MKNSIFVLLVLGMGVVLGLSLPIPDALLDKSLSTYILYALMLQVGISLGCSDSLKKLIRNFDFRLLLIPLSTIVGTLIFSAAASLILTKWTAADCMAVGSGFAYYSLSSLLITQLKEASVGIQIASELGTIALLTNIFRELLSLVGAPWFRKYFGSLAPVSAAGVNSMDVVLPTITRFSGKEMIPVAILHGILLDMSVPFFVTLFCQM
ncbi:lysine exporter LysO family protein [Bacteroides sp. OF04-15BH]|uniref:lysine exporter LysO family protein n=1 Tax=Bacteroides sp. OF04-15BH TaxID=2292281 RepID=UPI000E4BE949|nr:lysine exporter LysO family protein [Bacteroides sp. OF04-15BH]RHP61842.1 lysine exporter LysO family protein [Bacteroides sp. OF04-15BH]